MRITVNGVEIDVPEATTVDIVRDEDGQLEVFVDDEAAPEQFGYAPGLTLTDLVGLLTAPNPILSELSFVGVDKAEGPDETAGWKAVPEPAPEDDVDYAKVRADVLTAIVDRIDANLTEEKMAAIMERLATDGFVQLGTTLELEDLQKVTG